MKFTEATVQIWRKTGIPYLLALIITFIAYESMKAANSGIYPDCLFIGLENEMRAIILFQALCKVLGG